MGHRCTQCAITLKITPNLGVGIVGAEGVHGCVCGIVGRDERLQCSGNTRGHFAGDFQRGRQTYIGGGKLQGDAVQHVGHGVGTATGLDAVEQELGIFRTDDLGEIAKIIAGHTTRRVEIETGDVAGNPHDVVQALFAGQHQLLHSVLAVDDACGDSHRFFVDRVANLLKA